MNSDFAETLTTVASVLDNDTAAGITNVTCLPAQNQHHAWALMQLQASTEELSGLIQWAEALGDVAVFVLRRTSPYRDTRIEINGWADDVAVTVWTAPEPTEIAALWTALGQETEAGERTSISLDVLRQAASSDAEVTA